MAKDGFRGHSIGKAVFGLQAINVNDGKPIGVWRSVKRNLPTLLIPPFYLASQFQDGHRTGDGWSQSKVIWKKHSLLPIFLPKNSDDFVWTQELKEAEAENTLSIAVKLDIKGDWKEAFSLCGKIISDYPETQSAKDAAILLKALDNRITERATSH